MAHSKSKATTWLGIPVLIAALWSLTAPAVAEDTPSAWATWPSP